MIRWIRDRWTRRSGARAEGQEPPERLIVGLGNPGEKYESTRHNIGFRVVERLAARAAGQWSSDLALDARVAAVELSGQACLLIEPQTFMNRSGKSVAAACARWPELDPSADVLVIYDDLDLPTGRIRLRPSGGAGGHRGMADILDQLDRKSICRLRFGVGHPGASGAVIDWVLAPFPSEEEALLEEAVDRAADAVEVALRDGFTTAMGQFNKSI